jgi:hypothetical protein
LGTGEVLMKLVGYMKIASLSERLLFSHEKRFTRKTGKSFVRNMENRHLRF